MERTDEHTDEQVVYDFDNMSYDTSIGLTDLGLLFSWSGSPQGHNFWYKCHEGNTPQDVWLPIVEEMARQHKEYLMVQEEEEKEYEANIRVGHFIKLHSEWSEILYFDPILKRLVVAAGNDSGYGTYGAIEDCSRIVLDCKAVHATGLDIISKDTSKYVFNTNYGSEDEVFACLLGSTELVTPHTLSRWLRGNLYLFSSKVTMADATSATTLFEPSHEGVEMGKLCITRSAKDKKAGKRTTMKIGRALKHMFPDMEANEIEQTVTRYRTDLTPRVYTLHTGDSREDFAKAYTHQRSAYQNPATTYKRKSLASSCLHGTACGSDSISPAEVYASGDFNMVWLEDEVGNIGGRVVVRKGDDDNSPIHAPIYGSCDAGINQLQAYLDGIGAKDDIDRWSGARFLYVTRNDCVVAPYVDGELYGDKSSCGKYIVLTDDQCDTDFSFEGTGGYVSDSRPEDMMWCECCEGDVHFDDTFQTPDGSCMCEGCFNDHYVSTEDGTLPIEDAVEAYYVSTYTGRVSSNMRDIDNVVYCECVDEFWDSGSVTESDDGCDYVPTPYVDEHPDLIAPEEVDEEEDEPTPTPLTETTSGLKAGPLNQGNTPVYDFDTMVYDPDYTDLPRLFHWSFTPQGGDFWVKCLMGEIPQEVYQPILDDMREQYDTYTKSKLEKEEAA
tara:strand:- start:3130 stop:5133 length:2004 start_codon:yes stop_codon:yes gene_type:complete